MIFTENLNYLNTNYPDLLNLQIEDVRVGIYMTAIKLSDGTIGLASSEEDSNIHCDRDLRDFNEFSPLKIKDKTLKELFYTNKKNALTNSLRICAFNAIALGLRSKGKYKIKYNTDPIKLIDLEKNKQITVVGAFHNIIDKISKTNSTLKVLELDKSAMLERHIKYFYAAENYKETLPESDVVLITGLTLVNNTFDELLKYCNPSSQIVIIGPSAGLIPVLMFDKGVDIIATTEIDKPELVFDLVSQGAAAYHLFEYCASKICLVNE